MHARALLFTLVGAASIALPLTLHAQLGVLQAPIIYATNLPDSCSACIGSFGSCNDACAAAFGGGYTGSCAYPHSSDSGQCCSCSKPPDNPLPTPPAMTTCSGAKANPTATQRVVAIIDAIGCGNTWVAYANDTADAKICAKKAGYTPVDKVCIYDVQLYNNVGTVTTEVASDTEAHAIACANLSPGGCVSCSSKVVGIGECGETPARGARR